VRHFYFGLYLSFLSHYILNLSKKLFCNGLNMFEGYAMYPGWIAGVI
jgi:hypothetical protein